MKQPQTVFNLETILQEERARLVRLCAIISGEPAAADDLAQETLIEAWRNAHKLVEPEGYDRWLSAIARHVCRRWLRQHGRIQVVDLESSAPQFDQWLVDDTDLENDFEHDELAELIDKAIGYLSPETRTILTRRYMDEMPQAEVAAQLGMTENAVAVRLHRGKKELRHVLSTHLSAEMMPYGIFSTEDTWRETRMWCPECGQHYLLGRFNTEEFILHCPSCHALPSIGIIKYFNFDDRLTGIKTYKPALNRVMKFWEGQYLSGVSGNTAYCCRCGREAQFRGGIPDSKKKHMQHEHGIHLYCEYCGDNGTFSIDGVALFQPQARAFWQENKRIYNLPERIVTYGEQPAVLVRFESVLSPAYLDILFDPHTYEIVKVHRGHNSGFKIGR